MTTLDCDTVHSVRPLPGQGDFKIDRKVLGKTNSFTFDSLKTKKSWNLFQIGREIERETGRVRE